MDAALAWWSGIAEDSEIIKNVVDFETVRANQTDNWRYWRAACYYGSKLSVNFQAKPFRDKTSMAINHDNLAEESDVEIMRSFWKQF